MEKEGNKVRLQVGGGGGVEGWREGEVLTVR